MAEQDHPTGIDPAGSMNIQSQHALRLAEKHGLLALRWRVDMADEADVANLRATLRMTFGDVEITLPVEDGAYYLVYVPGVRGYTPVLVPEGGDARPFALALALARLEPAAFDEFTYHLGMLPVRTTA